MTNGETVADILREMREALAAKAKKEARVWCKHDPTRYCVDCEGCPDESEEGGAK